MDLLVSVRRSETDRLRLTEMMEPKEYRERGEPWASRAPFPAASRKSAVGCGSLDLGVSFDGELELAAATYFPVKGMWGQSLKLFSTSFILPVVYPLSSTPTRPCRAFLLSHKTEGLDSCSTKWQTGD